MAQPAAKRSSGTRRTSQPKRQRNTPQRRREILDAAAQVFYEKGYDAASTRDIADSVGLLKGSLYYYIESKEDFLYEIIKEQHEGALAALERVRATEGDALVRMAALIDTHVSFFTSNFVAAVIYFREFRSLSPERQADIRPKGDAYLDFVRELIRQGQREGTIDPQIDVRATSLGIVGMLNSLALWYHESGRLSAHNIAKQFASLVVAGLASEQASAPGTEHLRSKVLDMMDGFERKPSSRKRAKSA
ncbi:MAG: TetR/AcrR family transcriptional regulator [Acidimicrobiales bacterium]